MKNKYGEDTVTFWQLLWGLLMGVFIWALLIAFVLLATGSSNSIGQGVLY